MKVSVDLIHYEENDSDLRQAWNVLMHDSESNRYSDSSVYEKIMVAMKYITTASDDWKQGQQALLRIYGAGKRTTVGRWIQSARFLDGDVQLFLKTTRTGPRVGFLEIVTSSVTPRSLASN